MATTNIFGMPSGWLVYGMTSASLIESTIFIMRYGTALRYISEHRSTINDPWNNYDVTNSSAIAISIFGIIVNSVRCIFAIIGLVGQHMGTVKTLGAFLMFVFIGILANVICGIIGMHFNWTLTVAIATIAVTALHVLYLVIGIYICKLESNKIFDEQRRMPIAADRLPYEMPVHTTNNFITATAYPHHQIASEQRHPYNPYVLPEPDMYLPSYSLRQDTGNEVRQI